MMILAGLAQVADDGGTGEGYFIVLGLGFVAIGGYHLVSASAASG